MVGTEILEKIEDNGKIVLVEGAEDFAEKISEEKKKPKLYEEKVINKLESADLVNKAVVIDALAEALNVKDSEKVLKDV